MSKTKDFVIIGAGIAGLRAALEIAKAPNTQIVIIEKAKSVGGRVATRRFDLTYVNHGAQSFGGLDELINTDPEAKSFITHDFFEDPATNFPKKLRDELISKHESKVRFKFNWEVSKIDSQCVTSTEGETLPFDYLIMTAPIPQVEKISGHSISGVHYEKTILFIGRIEDQPVRIEMTPEWSERMFELSDESILLEAERTLNRKLKDLVIKKWRYARVSKGLKIPYYQMRSNILIAGDAFDPLEKFDLSASWLSGLNAGKEITRKQYE